MKSNYLILAIFQLIFINSSLAFEDEYFNANFANSSFMIRTNPIDNSLFIYKGNSLVLKASNFTIDGYSTLKEIKPSSDGFTIVNKGNSFSGQFEIYISYENNEFIVRKTKSYISYVSDGIFSITKKCQKNTNILLEGASVSDLEPLLFLENDKEFNKYCHIDVDSEYNLSWIEKRFKLKEAPIRKNLFINLYALYPIKRKTKSIIII
ncbi:hypothetical protein [Vibrio coralliilyticus]|uniref:Uncharacterized protein n=1 Tax=Vibrio coralliilyticus TaxID=190893 RepID=A0AAP6ZLB1_9VIBR|nr:hypothetical protein [Vibrio coralliilyticus]NOJ21375.1 hypothetical protein [Vibrio coralliilyticus]